MKRARLEVIVKLPGPHLVLADAGGDDRLALGQLVEKLDDVLRLDLPSVSLNAAGTSLPFLDRLVPLGEAPVAAGGVALPTRLGEQGVEPVSAFFTSAMIGRRTTLFLLISLASMSMWTMVPCSANFLHLAGHAVVETHAHGEQHVGLVDGVVGVHGAVHARAT